MPDENTNTLDAIIADEPAPAAPAVDVGDVVIFHDYADVRCDRTVRRAAIVLAVWSPTCVNLLVLGERGEPMPRTSVSMATAPGQPMTWERK